MSASSTTTTTTVADQSVRFGNLLEVFLQKTPESSQQVTDFVQKQKTTDLVNLLSFNYPKELKDVLMSRLMSICTQLTDSDVESMTYETLLELLSREDYETCTSKNLEVFLCTLLTRWFTANPKERAEDFVKCFGLLRQELLDATSLAAIVKVPQYQQCQDKLDRQMVELYTNQLTSSSFRTQQRQRGERQPKLLSAEEIALLKKGDTVDALDREGYWYTAVIEELTKTTAYVSFQGWDSRANEWIALSSQRLAVLGSVTRGKAHDRTKVCDCYACTRKMISFGRNPFAQLLMPLLTQVSAQ